MKELFGSSIWLIIGSMISNIFSFVYIILISQHVSPEIIGTLGAIMALQAAVGVLLSLGIPTGVQLYVGVARGEDDYDRIRSTVFTNMIVLVSLNLIATLFFSSLWFANISLLGFTPLELLIVSIIHILSAFSPILLALFTALLKTRITAVAQIVSSIIKIPVGLIAISISPGIFSACLGIIASYLFLDLILIFYWRRSIPQAASRQLIKYEAFNEVFTAGRPSWIPSIFTSLGESIGVLLIFNIVGGFDTGLFYIAFAIAYIIYLIPSSILGLLFPLLSSMQSGKTEAATQAIKLSMVLTIPLTLCLFIYPEFPLSFLGTTYVSASQILRLLLVGAFAFPLVVGYNSYAYANHEYKSVAALGFSTNIFRIIIYYPLVILYSGLGAALAYSSGVFAGALVAVAISRRSKLKFDWNIIGKIVVPPLCISIILILVQAVILIGIPILLLVTMIAYGRLGVITRHDCGS